jgi:hypothetical protein
MAPAQEDPGRWSSRRDLRCRGEHAEDELDGLYWQVARHLLPRSVGCQLRERDRVARHLREQLDPASLRE